jgi:RimJ/RimL family protein N-acetyltransferase
MPQSLGDRPPVGPIVLEGTYVRLEPLRPSHAPDLLKAGQSLLNWDWMLVRLTTPNAVDAYIESGLRAEATGSVYRFVVVLQVDGRVVGTTSYLDVQSANRGIEIGSTWYTPDVRGTAVNPEAKLLLLGHAFDDWDAVRVCLKTDANNLHSQAAIRKLGARYEGTLRQHMIRPDGSYRDSAYFSIVDKEWPEARERLERRVAAFGHGQEER